MARKKQEQQPQDTAPAETEPATGDPVAESSDAPPPEADPQLPRPSQGIILRNMSSGDPKRDFVTKFRKPRIDPECLIVDGQDPYLALPIDNDLSKPPRIRQIAAEHAADMLSCDPASGGTSIYRLATDREIAEYLADQKRRLADLKRKPRDNE